MKKLIIFAIIGGLGYLNYVNPKLPAHQLALVNSLSLAGGVPEQLHAQIWQEVDFSNFMICSVTKTVEGSKVISIGYLNRVKVTDKKWAAETVKKFQNRDSY